MVSNNPIVGYEVSVSGRDDGTIEAVYVRMRDGDVAETREVAGGVMLADYDGVGNLMGVELLAPVRMNDLLDLVETERRPVFQRFVERCAPREFLRG